MCAWFQKFVKTLWDVEPAKAPPPVTPDEPPPAPPVPRDDGGRLRRVTVGLDFGTSTSKCCFREEADRKPFTFVGFLGVEAGGSAPLFDSTVTFDGRTARFGPQPARDAGALTIKSFKMCLLCQSQHEQGIAPSEPCPRCAPAKPGSFDLGGRLVSAEELSTLHLGVMLSEVLPRIPTALGVDHSRIRIQLNAAAPLDQLSEFGSVGDYFERVVFYALRLAQKGTPRREWVLDDALTALRAVRIEPKPEVQDSPTRVFPETHAAITGYVLLPQSEKGLYGIVDIGAGTTDVSFFWLQKDVAETTAWYYAARTKRTGMDDVDRLLSPSLKVTAARLRAAREALSTAQLRSHQPLLRPVEQELYRHYNAVLEEATSVDQRDRAWCDQGVARFRLFLVGGGARCGPIVHRMLNTPPKGRAWETPPGLLGVPESSLLALPSAPPTTLQKSGAAGAAPLLLLAYGLANPRPEIPKYHRDREGVPRVTVPDRRFTHEELYGHT